MYSWWVTIDSYAGNYDLFFSCRFGWVNNFVLNKTGGKWIKLSLETQNPPGILIFELITALTLSRQSTWRPSIIQTHFPSSCDNNFYVMSSRTWRLRHSGHTLWRLSLSLETIVWSGGISDVSKGSAKSCASRNRSVVAFTRTETLRSARAFRPVFKKKWKLQKKRITNSECKVS